MPLPDFVSAIDNPYFPLNPGETYVYQSPDGAIVEHFAVTRDTINIQGVRCVVVEDTVFEDGVLVERTRDFHAQDVAGNVWYFGEDVRNFEDGKFVGNEGEWRAGRHDAEPGFIMLASPAVGDAYAQENAPGVAEDQALVTSLDGMVAVPYAAFDDVLVTEETTPLEPTVLDNKHYAPGVGLVFAEAVDGSEVLELVRIRYDGTSGDDSLVGRVGTDELHGFAGDDELAGNGGDDTLNGGRGTDSLTGGPGGDVFDFDAINDSPGGDEPDIIADFVDGADHIDLATIDADANRPGDQVFQFIGTAEFTAAGQLRVVDVDGGTLIQANVNNNPGADLGILVQGASSGDFGNTDFFV